MRKLAILAIFISAIICPLWSMAQQSAGEVFITWRGNTYVPPKYAGKAMPTAESRIFLSVFMTKNDRLVDLSTQNVYWYINDEFEDGGVGKQRINIKGPRMAAGTYDIRVEIPSLGVLKTIEIPFAPPRLAIETRLINNRTSESNLMFYLHPMFFNVGEKRTLDVLWSLNGGPKKKSEQPFIYNLEISPGSNPNQIGVALTAIASNPLFDLETVRESIQFNFVPK